LSLILSLESQALETHTPLPPVLDEYYRMLYKAVYIEAQFVATDNSKMQYPHIFKHQIMKGTSNIIHHLHENKLASQYVQHFHRHKQKVKNKGEQ